MPNAMRCRQFTYFSSRVHLLFVTLKTHTHEQQAYH